MMSGKEIPFGTDREAARAADVDLLVTVLERMLLIRNFENKIAEFVKKGIFRGSVHFSVGEEATAVGTCLALEPYDYILPTHRGHGQELAKGSDPKRLMAEVIGRETGLCGGRAGTLHVFDRENNILGAQAILGAQFPIAVGVGLAIKLKDLRNTAVVCFTGDSTTNTGNFYEALGMAALWELPVVFACINNVYGMGTRYEETCRTEIHQKGAIFQIRSALVDGNDVEAVYRAMKGIVGWVKEERKPALVELRTYRIMGHSANDHHTYRSAEEIEAWKERDPIRRLAEKLIRSGVSPAEIESVERRARQAILEAERFALESRYPEFDGAEM